MLCHEIVVKFSVLYEPKTYVRPMSLGKVP